MNKVILVGRLTRDPESRTTPSGHLVCNFTLAVDRRFKSADGERGADFPQCTAWRKTAEFIQQYFTKGKKIGVIGTLQTRRWEDNEGTTRYSTDVVVDEAYFVESKSAGEGPDAAAPPTGNTEGFTPGPDDDTSLPFDL